jgi:hypothetical protein
MLRLVLNIVRKGQIRIWYLPYLVRSERPIIQRCLISSYTGLGTISILVVLANNYNLLLFIRLDRVKCIEPSPYSGAPRY